MLLTTLESHERDFKLLADHESHGWSKKSDLSKWFGLGGGEHAFAGIVPGLPFDYVRLAPYDHLMHNEVRALSLRVASCTDVTYVSLSTAPIPSPSHALRSPLVLTGVPRDCKERM